MVITTICVGLSLCLGVVTAGPMAGGAGQALYFNGDNMQSAKSKIIKVRFEESGSGSGSGSGASKRVG